MQINYIVNVRQRLSADNDKLMIMFKNRGFANLTDVFKYLTKIVGYLDTSYGVCNIRFLDENGAISIGVNGGGMCDDVEVELAQCDIDVNEEEP